LRLKIGDYEVPERCLRDVVLYRAAPVSFGGVLVGDEGLRIKGKLRSLVLLKAVSYEAVDRNGVYATGFCDLRNLKFDENSTTIERFSGDLVRPYEQDLYWDVGNAWVRLHRFTMQ
jgi:hypothetical protein